MPTYDYRCNACGDRFEEFQSMTAKPLRKCRACGAMKLERLIGTGAGVIFKGSGFYETDYRSESYKKAAEAERKPSGDAPAKDGSGADAGSKERKKNGAEGKASGGSGKKAGAGSGG